MAKSPGKKKDKSKGPKKGGKVPEKAKGPSKSKDEKTKGTKTKKEKKGPLTKKDMDIAKLQKQKEEHDALLREEEAKAAAEKKLAIELTERDGQLAQSSAIIESYNRWVEAKVERMKSLQEWKTFRACRNIPDFNKLYEVNSYISFWLSQLTPPSMKKLLKLSPEYLQLLSELQFFLILPPDTMRVDLLKELGILYRAMIDNQITYINKCTYTIISDLSALYEPEVGICDYLLSIPDITHCLWGNIYCAPNIHDHEFEELKFKFRIPEALLTAEGIYRLIKTEYDQYSDSCLSYYPPGTENALKQSILDWVELHKLESSEYTELQSPAEPKKKKKKDKKGGKGKKGKKKGKSPKEPKQKKDKKGKKKRSGERSGSEDIDAATTTDEDDYKLLSDNEESNVTIKEKKEKKDKSKKKGKSKSGKAKGDKKNKDGGEPAVPTDESNINSTTEPESAAEEDDVASMSSFMARARKTLTEISIRQSMAQQADRTSMEEREEAEELRLKLEKSFKKATKGSKKKKKNKKKGGRDSTKESDSGAEHGAEDEEEEDEEEEGDEKEGDAEVEEEDTEQTEDTESGHHVDATSPNTDDTTPGSDQKAATEADDNNTNAETKNDNLNEEAVPSKSGKSKSKVHVGNETSHSTTEKGVAKSKEKKGKGKGKSQEKEKAKSGKETVKSDTPKKEPVKAKEKEEKPKKASTAPTKPSPAKSTTSKATTVAPKEQKKSEKGDKEKKLKVGKSETVKKQEKDVKKEEKKPKKEDKKGDKPETGDKGGGKKDNKAKGAKKGKGKADTSASESRTTPKEKTPKGSKPGSAKSEKSKSAKSDSARSKSKSPKGDGERKSRSKTKDKSKGKSASKSKSRSKSGGSKGKKSKKKGGKSKSKDRHKKTEAELAKERERAEKAKFIPQLHENELNLRNYAILGGVYQFSLLEIPPQPKNRGNWVIHIKEADNTLKEIPFEADYTPPAPADQESAKKTPEEMEREAKLQEEELQKLVLAEMSESGMGQQDFDLPKDPEEEAYLAKKMQEEAERKLFEEAELQYKGLMSVHITAPKVALWFEPPTPVSWDPLKRAWSTEGFYDIKFNESTLQLSFRTVRFGTFAFGHNRWSNLPYQSWELKPLGRDKMCFSLIAAIAVIEFIVMDDLICVSSLSNVTNGSEVEASLVNKYMKPHLLIKAMRYHGLDLFPEFDAYAYVDGVLVKDIDAEDHLYRGMALVSSAFNFQWSRWNLLAGRDRMVYQMRERHGSSSPGNYHMVLTTPTKSVRIDCTEVSPNYTENPVMEFEYNADLVNLVKGFGTDAGIRIINQTSPHYIETVRILLSSVRPLSFS